MKFPFKLNKTTMDEIQMSKTRHKSGFDNNNFSSSVDSRNDFVYLFTR